MTEALIGHFQTMARYDRLANERLYRACAALGAARAEEGRRIERFAAGLDSAFLAGSIAYRNNEGRDLSDPAVTALARFFNHQTHHRGQVLDMLSQVGAPPPVLDLHRVLNPTPS